MNLYENLYHASVAKLVLILLEQLQYILGHDVRSTCTLDEVT
jgi:hypothetical protein